MSAQNGDKSRFHRARKHKIVRRLRKQELLSRSIVTPKSANASAGVKPQPVAE